MINDLLAGLAWQASATGLWTYSPTGAYTAEQVGITIRTVPSSPDQLLVLTAFSSSDDPTTDSTVRVQARHRGRKDPRPVQDRSDALFGLWHNLHDVEIGGVPIVLMLRTSSVPIGADSLGRLEHSDNFDVQLRWSTPHRTD